MKTAIAGVGYTAFTRQSGRSVLSQAREACLNAIEDAGLWITDVEVLRVHYAKTAQVWRERFLADPEIPGLYDGRFRRMWEFYLAGVELGFRHGTHKVGVVDRGFRIGPKIPDYMAF